MSHIEKPCPVCNFPILKDKSDLEIHYDKSRYECFRCGSYFIDDDMIHWSDSNDINIRQSANLSGWIRERQLFPDKIQKLNDLRFLNKDNFENLLRLQTPTVDEKATKLLNYLAKQYPTAGAKFPTIIENIYKIDHSLKNDTFTPEYNSQNGTENFTYPIMSIAWAQDLDELRYLLHDYLSTYKNYLFDDARKITPSGWAFINQNPESQTVFFATRFDPELKKFQKKWVESAISDAGYNPIRMDDHNHNNVIDDEMILKIKQSKFIVVDFNENNFGAYYEAGFARGLNKDVISICPESQLYKKQIHFDANHYLFIPYNMENGKSLKLKFYERILATVGEGNYFEKQKN